MKPRFINPLTQFGKTSYELVVYDGDEIIYRQHCSFEKGVSDVELENYAEKIMLSIDEEIEEEIVIDKPQK